MTIAAHIHTSANESPFLPECISRLAAQKANDHFIIFSEKKIAALAGYSNCTQILISPVIKNSLLLHYWYNFKLPALLKKYNPAVFISENSACCLRTATPQIMIIKDDFIHAKKSPEKNIYSRYLKKYFIKFAQKAAAVAVTKAYTEQQLLARYPELKNKTITILHGLDNIYNPVSENERKMIQEKYAEGNGYFVCECSTLTQSHMILVLKAFSIFKKRLKSGMQLLLINKTGENPVPDFHIYKYRNEVQILAYVSKKWEADIVAAAYAAIYLPCFSSTNNWGLQCMVLGIPLITLEHKDLTTMYEDAAMYAAADEKKIADYMMILYKDETFRNVYINKGQKLAASYNWQDSSNSLWQTILQQHRD